MAESEENLDTDPDTTCPVCYAEFLDSEDLNIHVLTVHSTNKCHFCSAGYTDVENYAIHLRDAHILTLKSCQYCQRLFTKGELRNEHEKKHKNQNFTSANLYCCSQCPVKFTSLFNLEQHELNKHDDGKDGVFLNKYYSVLSSVLNMKAPTFIQSLGTNITYICACCKFSTAIADEYIDHVKENNCKSVACDNCWSVYQVKKSFAKHLSHHKECMHIHSEEDKFGLCTSCNKKIEKVHLKRHKISCNAIKCIICNTGYATVQELSKHQSAEHPLAIALTVCGFCHREFVGSTALTKHIDRSHRPDFHLYKYACIYCEPKYFKHPKALFGHFFSTHSDLKPYSCKICNITFRVRKRFTFHIKLEHKSIGFVEFDENYHVFFTDKKSEHPFQPTSLISPDQFPTFSKPTKEVEKIKTKTKTNKETDVSETEKSDVNNDDENKQKPEQTNGEKSEQTDIEIGRKPPKKRFKYDASKEASLANATTDFHSATETEAVQTETETNLLLTKSKKRTKTKNKQLADFIDTDDDDEPLVNVRKKLKKRSKLYKRYGRNEQKLKTKRKHLTCNVCKKYCYTQQNYHNHMSTHSRKEVKKCVKCSREFKSINALKRHIESEHKSSKLTETLKTLLERRKQGNKMTDLSQRERFLRTLRKVKPVKSTPAIITEASEKLSVQSFIENFTPEQKTDKSEPVVTVKTVNCVSKPPIIKMKKFTPKPLPTNVKLAMPVRFKNPLTTKTKVTLKMVHQPVIQETFTIDDSHYQDSVVDYDETPESPVRNDNVPEVAEEVIMGSEEPKRRPVIPHKIIIPKLPEGYSDISIAHLQSEAPYFKIVKMSDLEKNKNNEQQTNEQKKELTLPTGTKLVTVNPLAHLLGDTPIEKLVGEKNKYYKSKRSNYQEAIAKALLNLEKKQNEKRNSKKKNLEVEQ